MFTEYVNRSSHKLVFRNMVMKVSINAVRGHYLIPAKRMALYNAKGRDPFTKRYQGNG